MKTFTIIFQLKSKMVKATNKELTKVKDNHATEKTKDPNNQKSPKDEEVAKELKEDTSTNDSLSAKDKNNETNSPKTTKNVAS